VRRFVIKDPVYRIYVGPIESLEKAQQLCAQVKQRDSGQKCQPVIN
jgi:cell division septation protein DedD